MTRPHDNMADRRAHQTQRAELKGERRSEQGLALVMAVVCVAVLGIMLADMHEVSSTSFAVSVSRRDALQSEYMAKSALNLTRLLIAKEPEIRRSIDFIYRAATKRAAPQLPVWKFADGLLGPFCDKDATEASDMGIDFSDAEGFDGIPGTCTITAVSENAKININDPLFMNGQRAADGVAMQLFALMGGYQSPSPYDEFFLSEDPDGNLTSREGVVSAVIDWWDPDTQRTDFDPGSSETQSGGSEDDALYQRLDDPYKQKNAPFDSIEELRLVRGFGDDFWATFIEPRPNDPASRTVTIYASGLINVNEAPPEVLLARVCSLAAEISLCIDPLEAAKFTQLLGTVRELIPVPFFSTPADFLNFIEGKGTGGDLYATLTGFLGEESGLLFQPVVIPPEAKTLLQRSFVTTARIFSIIATGRVGRAKTTMNTVVNFHNRWVAPPPNAGTMPGLGVLHYYRVD